MKKLIEGLRHFQTHLMWEREELFQRAAQGQHPTALLITCSDSRVLPETLMQADPGDLFVSRNPGNLVPPPEVASGEAATVEYAVSALGVTDLIVCGHYRCGAIKALLHPEEAANLPLTTGWLTHAAATRGILAREYPNLEGEELWDKAVELNVLVQVDNLAQHPAVAVALAAGTVRLHAWVLRFESGEIYAYHPQSSTFCPLLDMPAVHSTLPVPEAAATEAVDVPETVPQPELPRWFEALKSDVPASLVVFMVALPLCLAIAKACAVPAEVGLITGIVGGILVGLLAGSPLQVSGPAAGLIVILLDVVQEQGIAMLGVVVFLAGLMQVAAGALRLGQWFRAVSPAVIIGMLAGIGAVIFAQQFHVVLDDAPSRNPLMNFLGIPVAMLGILSGHEGHPEHVPAALVGVLTLLVLLFWKPFCPKALRAIPAVLVAVVLATAVTALLALPVARVEFDSLAAAVKWLDFTALPGLLVSQAVWGTAATIALVASAETLLCAAAVDQMHRGSRTQYDRELAAQGVGNAVCGLLGALPLTGVIVRSSANVQAGGRTRWSAVLHGVWILAFVLLLPGLLRLVPTAALAAILVLTGIKLIEIHAMRVLWRESWGEGVICLVTAVTVVVVDLLTGVLLGVGLSIIKLIHMFSRLRIRQHGDPAEGQVTLVLEGCATFIRLPRLAAALEAIPPGTVLHVDFKGLSYIDHACLQLIINWEKQHEATGGQLVLDWEILRARFQRARPRPRKNH